MIKNYNILLIEDDKTMVYLIKVFLQGSSFKITHCHPKRNINNVLKKQKFDMVITDYFMSPKNGFDIITEIRNNNKTMLIMLLTLKVFDMVELKFILSNTVYYEAKPILPHLFRMKLAQILGKSLDK